MHVQGKESGWWWWCERTGNEDSVQVQSTVAALGDQDNEDSCACADPGTKCGGEIVKSACVHDAHTFELSPVVCGAGVSRLHCDKGPA